MLFDPSQLSLNTKSIRFLKCQALMLFYRSVWAFKCSRNPIFMMLCRARNNERTGNACMFTVADIQVKKTLHLSWAHQALFAPLNVLPILLAYWKCPHVTMTNFLKLFFLCLITAQFNHFIVQLLFQWDGL